MGRIREMGVIPYLRGLWHALSTPMARQQANHAAIKRVQQLRATVIRACTRCGAPGVDENGNPVGDNCPNCGAPRPKSEDKGVIWKRTWI